MVQPRLLLNGPNNVALASRTSATGDAQRILLPAYVVKVHKGTLRTATYGDPPYVLNIGHRTNASIGLVADATQAEA